MNVFATKLYIVTNIQTHSQTRAKFLFPTFYLAVAGDKDFATFQETEAFWNEEKSAEEAKALSFQICAKKLQGFREFV